MKRTLPGSLITLVFGAAFAVGLLIVNILAAKPSAPTAAAAAGSGSSGSAPAGSWPDQASYKGPAKGGRATVTVSVRGSKAVGLVCRGSSPTWLAGSTSGGRMTMTGTGGSSLSADYTDGKAAGNTTAGGNHYTFSAPRLLTAVYNSLRDHRTHCPGADDNQGGGQASGGGDGDGGGGHGGGGNGGGGGGGGN